MKAIVVALTLALVACQGKLSPDFAASQTYVYRYEAVILGGMSEPGLARAGVKVACNVLISRIAQNTYLLKLVEPEIFEYSGIWPKDQFIPAPKLTEALAAQLLIPVKFEYASGVVGKVFAPAGVSTIVLNVHRGILNALQLNIKKTQNVYEMQEAGAQGVCKTDYVISEDQKADRIYVTKSKDLDKCNERIMTDVGMAYAHPYAKDQEWGKKLRGAAAYNYVMKPTANGALIMEATVREIHQFSLFNEMTGAGHWEARQLLAFVETQNVPVHPYQAEYIPRGSLQYEFADELHQIPIQLIKIENVNAQAIEILTHLVTNNVARVHDDAPLKFIQLVQLLRLASYEDINAIWAQEKEKPAFRHWILEAVPAIGTQVSVRFIKEKFLAGEVTVSEAAQALLAAVHLVKADVDTVNYAASLVFNPKVQVNPILREIAMLGYGSMVFKLCAVHHNCPADVMKPVYDIAADAVAKANLEDIILAVKVLGNAGHPASIKPIMKLLPGFGSVGATLPVKVQADVVMALRNIAKRERRMVQEIAVQLFMDRALHQEVRMVACVVLFETRPTMGLVVTLADDLLTEPSMQVASFAYSYMKALTRSTAPDLIPVGAACNVAVRVLSYKLDRLSYRYSKAIHIDTFKISLMAGAAATAYVINDAATILPRAVVAKVDAYMVGAAAQAFEFGFRTEGLQEALAKIPASPAGADRITRMRRILKSLADWRSLPASQPLASMYLKIFGQEVSFANIDKAIIEQIAQIGTGPAAQNEVVKKVLNALQSGAAIQWAKPLLAAEVRRIFPTCASVPMEINFYVSAVALANINVAAAMMPPPFENFHIAQLMKTKINLKAHFEQSSSLQAFFMMGVNTALIQGVMMAKTKANFILPVKFSAKVDIAQGNFKIEALPLQGVDQIVAVSVQTVAVARNRENLEATKITPVIPAASAEKFSYNKGAASDVSDSSAIIDSQIIDKPMSQEVSARVDKTLCATLDAFGIQACVKITSENAGFIQNAPIYKLTGEHAVIVAVKPVGAEVIMLEIDVQMGAKAVEKIIRVITLEDEEQIQETEAVLTKLKKILNAGVKNTTSSSSSSSRSPSSRSSSSSSSSSFRENYKFTKFHKHQKAVIDVITTKASSSSQFSSSSSSFEAISKKLRFLGDAIPPALAVIIRAVKAGGAIDGYQIAAYVDKDTARLQVIMAALAERDNWMMCADAILLSIHKAMAKVAWGAKCEEYATVIKAETGLMGSNPAARLKLEWTKIPRYFMKYSAVISDYIPGAALMAGLNVVRPKNSKKEIEITAAATSARTINVIIKTSKMTLYKLGVYLPTAFPIGAAVPHNAGSIAERIYDVFSEVYATQCTMSNGTLTTFNNRRYKYQMPASCYQVLAQDCTPELKFMVLLKKDHATGQDYMTIKIHDIDVDLFMCENTMELKVNNIQDSSLSDRKKLASHSVLPDMVYMKCTLAKKVQVADWMKGQTCGVCGKADGEVRQDIRTPSGRLTKDALSFAHSWVLSAESCRDSNQCYMRQESVKLEKQMNVNGLESKCYSVEPVLRCLSGCHPLRTTPVTVGFHCLSTDSNVDTMDNIWQQSVDLMETIDSHVVCRCLQQCI